MVNWENTEYVNPRQRKMKDLETGKIYTFEIQDDPDNIVKQSQTPVRAENLNKMQTDLQQQIATAKTDLETQINTAKSDLTEQINETESSLNTSIQNVKNNMTTTRTGDRVGDTESKTFTVDINDVYLLINTHAYKRCIMLITTYTEKPSVDVIFKNDDTAVPTVSQNWNQLTITSKYQARIYLYKINGVSSS